jgi:hypothetical protein
MMRWTVARPMPVPGNSSMECKTRKGAEEPSGVSLVKARAVIADKVSAVSVGTQRAEFD